MEITAYNPQKGRLETLEVEQTEENTTWFKAGEANSAVATITDFDGGLLIKEFGHTYPIWLYDLSRADVDYNGNKARQLMRQYE